MLTPGDIEAIKTFIAAFGLTAIVLPDIADSLDGHLIEEGFSTLTYGGTPPSAVAEMGQSAATLVIGPSMNKAADLLRDRTGLPDYRFASLIGLDGCDAFCRALAGNRRLRRFRRLSSASAPNCRTQWSIASSRSAAPVWRSRRTPICCAR